MKEIIKTNGREFEREIFPDGTMTVILLPLKEEVKIKKAVDVEPKDKE